MKAIKTLVHILPFVLLLLLFCIPERSTAQIEIDTTSMGPPEKDPTLEDLKDSLSNSGNWVQITEDEMDPEVVEGEESNEIDNDVYSDYIWIPNPIFIYVGWNPYIDGRWVWTCWGWQWIPYENWGWCTYHYGRWWHHHRYGWVWSPGHRWRHNWVTWYRSGGYWGWHPIPPRRHYIGGIAVIPRTADVNNDGWVFVNKKDFTKTVDKTTIVDAGKHNEIFGRPNETVQEKEKKTQTLGPNVNVPNTKKPDTKIQVPQTKTEKKTNDYGTPNDPGNKKVEKPVEKKENNKSDNNSGNKKSETPKSNDNGYSPPKNEYKPSPPPKTETKQSPLPKVEQKQSPPPKTDTQQSPPPKKDNSNGN